MASHHRKILVWLLVAAIPAAAAPAWAARYHVRTGGARDTGPSAAGDWTPANCYATLAAAALAAAPADSILLFPETHACAEVVALPAFLGNRALEARPDSTEVACGGPGRLVVEAPGPGSELRGVTFTGGAELAAAGLTVANPGAPPCSLAVRGCDFRGFRAQGTATAGGSAVRGTAGAGGLFLEFAGCSFTDNRTVGPGGAVFAGDGVDLAFSGCFFVGNESSGAGGRGGALAARSAMGPTSVRLEDCVFTGSLSSGPAGAISADNVSLHLQGCRVEGSRSAVGGLTDWSEGAGIFVTRDSGLEGPVTFTAADCTFADNVGGMLPTPAAGDGGALMIKGSRGRMVAVEVERCGFTANYNAQGAGIYIGRYATGVVRRCRFTGNRAWYQGGAAMKGGALVYNYGETATFDSCEFVGNEAGCTPDGAPTGELARGGALAVRNRPRAVVRHCTFVDNRVSDPQTGWGDAFAHAREGGSWGAGNRCVLLNSLFWGEDGHHVQVWSEDGGLEQAARLALSPGQFSAPGTVEEGFVWLASYPLSGAQDLVPAAGSPLLDQALDLGFTVDLAGTAVPQGPAPDIGAYERPAGAAAVAPGAVRAALAAWPNPFNPRTVVTATVARAGVWHLAVHDLRGRRVAVLFRGRLDPGTHAWPWDARDAAGRPLPSGLYLARLTGPAAPATTKLTLLR